MRETKRGCVPCPNSARTVESLKLQVLVLFYLRVCECCFVRFYVFFFTRFWNKTFAYS